MASWIATGIALLGGAFYFIQSLYFSHMQASLLDEGAYLLKGYYFATGRYWPYQDFGPWTNHMPLAFLIPGYIQLVFGPGLRTGRYLAVALGLLSVLGVWVTARRLGGRWWATLAVWALALNPAVIKLYSLANSQSLLACMLVWVMALTLGEKRPFWQLLLGSGLAGLMLVTRVNMTPILLLLVGYIGWEYGRRTAVMAAVAGWLPVVIVHAIFWPGILKIWAHWIPVKFVPFLKPWAHPLGAAPSWNPTITLQMRVMSFIHGIRFHFVALVGAISTWLLWPARGQWKSKNRFKTAVYLSALLGIMVLSHMWAALGKDYCVFCFPVYLSFFTIVGIFLVILSFNAWRRDPPIWRQVLVTVFVLLLSMALGYGAYAEIGNDFLPLLELRVPRVRSFQILPGSIELRGLLQNKFALATGEVVQIARFILPAIAGLIIGFGLLIAAILLARYLSRSGQRSQISFGSITIILFLILGYLLTPSAVLGGGYSTYDCRGDVISSYETAGKYLAQKIPNGALVYWQGGNSAVPLLYLPNAEIFPAQINGDYSFRLGGDPDALARYGFWSEVLAHDWAQQADYILIEERLYSGWLSRLVDAGGYDELDPTPQVAPCQGNSAIHIFRRKR